MKTDLNSQITETQTEQQYARSSIIEGGNSCSLKGALFFTYGIKGALPLLHAGPGCSWCAYYGTVNHSGDSFPFANTGMFNNEVIFGGETKLDAGIKHADEIYNPELMIITSGCQPLTIGDDINAIVDNANQSGLLNAKVIASETGGYEGDLYDGFIKTGVSCLKRLCKPQEVKKKVVNIIGFPTFIDIYWKGDIIEIRDILNDLGLEINCFYPGDATIESIEKIPSAELNLVVDDQIGVEMAEYLKETYGTPYIKPNYGILIGTDNTYEFLIELIETLKLPESCRKKVEERRENALRMASQGHHVWVEFFQHAFEDFAITAHGSMAMGICRMLISELGLAPKTINLNPSYPGGKEKLEELIKSENRGLKGIILENKDNYELSQTFNGKYPTLLLGKGETLRMDAQMSDTRVFMTISYPCLDRIIVYNRPIMGFNGLPAFLDDMLGRAV